MQAPGAAAPLTRAAGTQIKPYQAFVGGQDFTATGFYAVLGPLMGVPDASRFATEDLIAETLVGGPPLSARWSRAAPRGLAPKSSKARCRRATAMHWQARR